jgi:hypothetical protein
MAMFIVRTMLPAFPNWKRRPGRVCEFEVAFKDADAVRKAVFPGSIWKSRFLIY